MLPHVFQNLKDIKPDIESKLPNLSRYISFLIEQNKDINLIARSTIENIWERHVLDSAQLLKYMKDDEEVIDIGSGAGFPGIVLSILGIKKVSLIEKSFHKSNFLKQASKFSTNRIIIYQNQIEELDNKMFHVKHSNTPRVITARAFKSLKEILAMLSKYILSKDDYYLLHKGRRYLLEIEEAKKYFNFSVEIYNSITDNDAVILKLFHVKRIQLTAVS